MKRTRTLIVPFIAALLTVPLSNCGDGGDVESPDPDAQSNNEDNDDKSDTATTSGGGDTKDKESKETDSSAPDDSSDAPKSDLEPVPGDIDCSKLKVTGIGEGQVPPNVSLVDASGSTVNLHDYCNAIVYVMAGSMF